MFTMYEGSNSMHLDNSSQVKNEKNNFRKYNREEQSVQEADKIAQIIIAR